MSGIRLSPEVLDVGELEAKVAALLADVDTTALVLDAPARRASPLPFLDAAARAEQLHQLWGRIVQRDLPPAAGVPGQVKRFTKRVVRRLVYWYVEPRWGAQHEFDAEIARFATDAVLANRRVHSELRDARLEIDTLRRDLDNQGLAIQQSITDLVERVQRDLSGMQATLARIEAESGEWRDQIRTLVPTLRKAEASYATAAARQADLEDLVNARASSAEVHSVREELTELMKRLGVAAARGAHFDYVAFEERFRGDSHALAEAQREYLARFPPPDHPGAIADIGCGRGEMLEVMRAAGHDVVGVDLDDNMLEVCRAKHLPVTKADGVAWLENQSANSLKGIFSAQVVEHLLTPEIERMVCASLAALRVGGVLVMETINPRSLHALGNHFFADLSHVRPVHPETLRFMCEQAGFTDVALVELSPHPALQAAAALEGEATDEVVRQLVSSVFGYQDYAIVATKGA